MSIPVTLPYFICDNCQIQQSLTKYESARILEKELNQSDIAVHCGLEMRLSNVEKILDTNYLPPFNTLKNTIASHVKMYFHKTRGNTKDGKEFEAKYVESFDDESKSEEYLNSLRQNLISTAKSICDKEDEISSIVEIGEYVLDNCIRNALERMDAGTKPYGLSKPVLPGSKETHSIEFVCAVCNELVEVDPSLKKEILEAENGIDLPIHHEKSVLVKIIQHRKEKPSTTQNPPTSSYNPFSSSNVEEMEITSVGIDIGSSTSHLVFSQIHLRREVGFINMTGRYNIVNRKVLYESEIIDTPLLNPTTIDVDSVVEFCRDQYMLAGFVQDDIDTGAVIVTGETAKKSNADEIVNRLSGEAGKFVSATAGPNLESFLSAMGSGAVAISLERQLNVLNVDIGGGTSNLALISNGKVIDTSCINVGGRLLGIESDFKIWRMDEPTSIIMKYLNLTYSIGDMIKEIDLIAIVDCYANALFEVLKGKVKSELTRSLMMTTDIDYSNHKVDAIIYSGGISELIYSEKDLTETSFRDIGKILAQKIKSFELETEIIEPLTKIRATVIGAGSYSLSISGSTTSYDKNIPLPLFNIPILVVDAKKEDFSKNYIIDKIESAFIKHDIIEGEEVVALYFDDPIYARDMFVPDFVKAIEESLPNSINKKQLIILIFRTDVAGTIGMHLKRETLIQNHFLCLDEIELEEGNWIDIGETVKNGKLFPVTVKSLIFN